MKTMKRMKKTAKPAANRRSIAVTELDTQEKPS